MEGIISDWPQMLIWGFGIDSESRIKMISTESEALQAQDEGWKVMRYLPSDRIEKILDGLEDTNNDHYNGGEEERIDVMATALREAREEALVWDTVTASK